MIQAVQIVNEIRAMKKKKAKITEILSPDFESLYHDALML
jgi:hypothetical protein